MFAAQKPLLRPLTVLLALVLTVSLTVGAGLFTLRAAFSAESLRRAGEAVLPLQLERVRGAVREAAETYHFSAGSVLPLVTEENLRAVSAQAEEAVREALSGGKFELPWLTLPGLEAAILEDETFIAEVPAVLRENVARDEASALIERELSRAVFPLRASIAEMASLIPGAEEGVFGLIAPLFALALRAALISAAASAALLLLLALLSSPEKRLGPVWLLGSAGAAGLCVLLALLLLFSQRIGPLAGELSPIMEGMIRSISGHTLLPAAVLCGAAFALSLAGIALLRREARS